MVWADPLTYSGADNDLLFDDNDELVFMARHLGDVYDGVTELPPDLLPLVTKSLKFDSIELDELLDTT